eukprot:GFYU01016550.1.p1 GENE.GFYU01016550.1~~GFYU01016550.1.p1  ORF type:complete len:479 (+),score=55.24 GFYU01016550.1:113-1438(+)
MRTCTAHVRESTNATDVATVEQHLHHVLAFANACGAVCEWQLRLPESTPATTETTATELVDVCTYLQDASALFEHVSNDDSHVNDDTSPLPMRTRTCSTLLRILCGILSGEYTIHPTQLAQKQELVIALIRAVCRCHESVAWTHKLRGDSQLNPTVARDVWTRMSSAGEAFANVVPHDNPADEEQDSAVPLSEEDCRSAGVILMAIAESEPWHQILELEEEYRQDCRRATVYENYLRSLPNHDTELSTLVTHFVGEIDEDRVWQAHYRVVVSAPLDANGDSQTATETHGRYMAFLNAAGFTALLDFCERFMHSPTEEEIGELWDTLNSVPDSQIEEGDRTRVWNRIQIHWTCQRQRRRILELEAQVQQRDLQSQLSHIEELDATVLRLEDDLAKAQAASRGGRGDRHRKRTIGNSQPIHPPHPDSRAQPAFRVQCGRLSSQ